MSNNNRGRSFSIHPNNSDLYADPSRSPSPVAVRTRKGSISAEVGLNLPLYQKFEKQIEKTRRQSDTVLTEKVVKEWSKSANGKEAHRKYLERQDSDHRLRQGDLQARTQFAPIKLISQHRSLSDASARPIDQLREGLLKTTMRVDVRNFLKGSPLPTVPGSTTVSRRQSLDGSDNDECAIDDSTTFDEAAIQRQEESMQRRQAFVQRQIAEENKDFQKQVNKLFDYMVDKHEKELDHDINTLRYALSNLYVHVLEANGGPYGEEADKRILSTSRFAYLLDRTLLRKHYFQEHIEALRRGPAELRNEMNLQKALEKATAQTMKLGREGDGLQHRCGSDFDWHCQGCYQHAQHLYKPRNNELHEEVLRLKLYHFFESQLDSPSSHHSRSSPGSAAQQEEEIWNKKYWFAAFACELVATRQRIRGEDGHSGTRNDKIRRTAVIFVKFHEALEKSSTSVPTLQQANKLFSDIFESFNRPKNMSYEDVKEFCADLKLRARIPSVPVDHSPPRRALSPSAILDSQQYLRDHKNKNLTHQMELWDEGTRIIDQPRRTNSTSPQNQSRSLPIFRQFQRRPSASAPTRNGSSRSHGHRRDDASHDSSEQSTDSSSSVSGSSTSPSNRHRLTLEIPAQDPSQIPAPLTGDDSAVDANTPAGLRRKKSYFGNFVDLVKNATAPQPQPKRPRSSGSPSRRPPFASPTPSQAQVGATRGRDFVPRGVSRTVTAYSPARRPRGRSVSVHRRVASDEEDL